MNQQLNYIRSGRAAKMAGVSTQWLTKIAKQGKVPGASLVDDQHLFDATLFIPWVKEYVKRPKKASDRGVNGSLKD